MKQWLTRAAAAVLVLQMLTAPVLGAQVLQKSSLPLADSMGLTSSFLGGEGTQKEHVLTYRPGGDLQAKVVFGNTLYGRSTMDYIADYVTGQGYTPVAAVNASFFDMSNGLPIGMVVTEGILRANGGGTAVGIEADGTIRIGSPVLKVEGSWKGETILLHYNQLLLENNGIVLYSRDYDAKTKGGVSGYHVVLEVDEGTLTLDSKLEATVTEIVEDTKLCAIPKGGFVLSIAEKGTYEPYQKAMRALKPGDKVLLTTTIDAGWEDVEYAVGGGDLLVEQGRALSSFQLDSASRQAPRTALGLKADGSVVLYTVDRSDISDGMTLPELAQRMAELGCITAVNLDGGGSTCVGVTRPGERTFTTVNDPSDGKQRPCANYLFFVRPARAAGPASKLFIYPYDLALLPGGQVQLTAKAADRNYMPAVTPGNLVWYASGGTVENGLFTAGEPGTATVAAKSGDIHGTAAIHVVETPTSMEVLREDNGRTVEKLLMESGTSLDLTVQAQYLGTELAARDTSFRWFVPEHVGAVDENGVLTAGEREDRGIMTVTCGDLIVEIPLEVRINPMVDLEGHWAREPISQLYFRDVLKGSENAQGEMVYRPDDSMTRQEFIVALVRWLQIDPADYAHVELPFADNSKIADWAMDAMKAAYHLEYLTGSGKNGKVYAEPGSTITREAAMTILARTQNASSASDALEDFADESSVSSWAREALAAMVEQGVINGINGKLQPKGNVTRAQVAKMLFAMED